MGGGRGEVVSGFLTKMGLTSFRFYGVDKPLGNCIAAAEHAVALICGLSRCLGAADRTLKAGGWDRSKFVGVSLVGKTIGVVGLGRIGREVAKRCLVRLFLYEAHLPIFSFRAELMSTFHWLSCPLTPRAIPHIFMLRFDRVWACTLQRTIPTHPTLRQRRLE